MSACEGEYDIPTYRPTAYGTYERREDRDLKKTESCRPITVVAAAATLAGVGCVAFSAASAGGAAPAHLFGKLGSHQIATAASVPLIEDLSDSTVVCWTDKTALTISCADGSEVSVMQAGLTYPRDVVYDAESSSIYFTDMTDGLVQVADFAEGADASPLFTGLESPQLLVLDSDRRRMYWTDEDAGMVRGGNLDGSGEVEDMVAVAESDLVTLAMSNCGTYLYWTDYAESTISRVALDNLDAGAEVMLSDLNGPKYMDVGSDSRMYWCADACTSIKSATMEGKDITTHLTDIDVSIKGISVDADTGSIYWTETTNGQVVKTDLESGEASTTVSGLDDPFGLAVIHRD